MGDDRLHSLLGVAEYRIEDIAPMRSPFVSRQLARAHVNSLVEMLQPPADSNCLAVSAIGGAATEARVS
jgi:hypothetical protein